MPLKSKEFTANARLQSAARNEPPMRRKEPDHVEDVAAENEQLKEEKQKLQDELNRLKGAG